MWWPGKHTVRNVPFWARIEWWRAWRLHWIKPGPTSQRYIGKRESWYDGPIYEYGFWFFELLHYETADMVAMWTTQSTYDELVAAKLPIFIRYDFDKALGSDVVLVEVPGWIQDGCKFYRTGRYADLTLTEFLIRLFNGTDD